MRSNGQSRVLLLGLLSVLAQRLGHIVRRASRFRHRTPRAYYVLALLALALLLPSAALKVAAQAPAKAKADVADGAGEKTDAERAPARLKTLGAEVTEQPCEPGEREIWVMFDEKWHGTDADLAILDEVAPLAKVGAASNWAMRQGRPFRR